MSALISIITVNYYSEDEILVCYKSIIKHATLDSLELILVSNSPLNNTFLDQLELLGIDVKIIDSGRNLGFAKGCNLGADAASGDFLFFLNPDTIFQNNVPLRLLECHNSNPLAGVIGPKTLNKLGKVIASIKNHLSLGFYISLMLPFFNPFISKSKLSGHIFVSGTQAVPIVNGHAMFVKASLFKKINGFNELFFMYWEENDLCLRIKNLGLETIYCCDAELIHIAGTSTSAYFSSMEIEKHRSQKKFVQIHHPSWNFINRLSGIIGYLWRLIGSLFIFKRKKIKQFWVILFWYSFKYK